MHLGEGTGQQPVTAHGEQHTAARGLCVQGVGDAHGKDVHHKQHDAEPVADGDGAGVEQGRGSIELIVIRFNKADDVGLEEEHRTDDDQRDQDGAAHVFLRFGNLLCQRADAVKTGKVQGRNGAGRGNEGQVDLVRLIDGRHGQLSGPSAAEHVLEAADHDDQDDADFNDEEEHVHAGRGLNALYVDSRVHGDEDENPDPARDLRDEALAPVADKDVQQAGNKNIVEQDEPPGEEAHMRVHAALHVRVHAPGDGEAFRHLDVGQRRKEHGAEAYQIHERRHALRIPVHVSEDTVRGDNDHEQQAVDGQIPQAQGTVQFLLVPELFDGPFFFSHCNLHKC